MGCFLGCFGHRRKKNHRRQKRRESFQPPRLNRISEGSIKDNHLKLKVPNEKEVTKVSEESTKDDHLIFKVPIVEEVPKISEISITEICDNKADEKQSPSPTRKKVTFDSNVKTYEHIVVEESIEIFEEKPLYSTLARCSSEGSSSNITSISSGSSFPENYRYQNCRESDDEEDEDEILTDCDESDDDGYDWDEEVYTEEIADNVLDIESIKERTKESSGSVRDRSGYVNSVLNPIENLTQWKALKSKGRTMTQTQNHKENASFSFKPSPKSRDENKKQRNQEIAVDASLSTWLSTSNSGCISSVSMSETATSAKKIDILKQVQSHDERPVLCALTAEEIKQFSATNSPRKSLSRSPESPIIGTVGGYWNIQTMANRK